MSAPAVSLKVVQTVWRSPGVQQCAVHCGMSWYEPEAFQNQLYHTYFPQAHACQALSGEPLCSHAHQVENMMDDAMAKFVLNHQPRDARLGHDLAMHTALWTFASCVVLAGFAMTEMRQAVVSISIPCLNICFWNKKTTTCVSLLIGFWTLPLSEQYVMLRQHWQV